MKFTSEKMLKWKYLIFAFCLTATDAFALHVDSRDPSGYIGGIAPGQGEMVYIEVTVRDNGLSHLPVGIEISNSQGRTWEFDENETKVKTYFSKNGHVDFNWRCIKECQSWNSKGDSHSVIIDIWAVKQDIQVDVSMDKRTGEIFFKYSVGDQPFDVGGYNINFSLWYGASDVPKTEILTQQLEHLIGKKNYSRSYRIKPANRRVSIPIGQNQLIGVIDFNNDIHESNEANNKSVFTIDETFMAERVVDILRATSPGDSSYGMPKAAELLDAWRQDTAMRRMDPRTNNLDWTVGSKNILSMAWALDPANWSRTHSKRDRVKKAYDSLLRPDIFANRAARVVLRDRLRRRFASSTRNTIQLSRFDLTPEEYHAQHIQRRMVQEGGWRGLNVPLDAITAAIGGHSMYVVPFGTAIEDRQAKKYHVTIESVALHIADGFEFRGFQPLGCFKLPSFISLYTGHLPFSGYTCLWNYDFRTYRRVKRRGSDYVNFIGPKIERFSSPVSFDIKM
jgi:hypothetical protein